MTHDPDFSDAPKVEPGKHAGVLIVRLPDSEQWRVGAHLVGWFSDPDARAPRSAGWFATIHSANFNAASASAAVTWRKRQLGAAHAASPPRFPQP